MKTISRLHHHIHGARWCDAFIAGAKRHGLVEKQFPDLLVTWGIRQQENIAAQIARGGEVCILECGYLGDRLEQASASFGGGLNGRGRFPLAQDNGERFRRQFSLEPWSRRVGYALIMGQVPGDMSLESVNGDLSGWYEQAAQMPESVFRPHPLVPDTPCPPGARPIGGTLTECLAGARVAVTFNSNSGVDAILAGVPTIATDPGSMAWPVASHDFNETPARPNRDEWAARMAWCQWTIDEMSSGYTWEILEGWV